MGTIIAVLFIVGILAYFVWDWRRVGAGGATGTKGRQGSSSSEDSGWTGDATRDLREAEDDYWLEWRESADGQSCGYIVVRSEDNQRLSWRSLPRSKGFSAVGVAGESYRREVLQSADFAPGRELTLVPEPDNPNGETRVAIKSPDETKHIGYVPADESRAVFRMLQEGEELRCYSMWETRQDGERRSIRVLIAKRDASISLP